MSHPRGSNQKKSGQGNGNSVINNHENSRNAVSGDTPSSSSHKFSDSSKDRNSK
ncbi:hypothetical protein [Anaeromicropila herbilytica]|uniref:Uncharacterized protein n=1 Tax=Anaeromicropila herbilytica TaxID=2785025 RepID=A0A7R7IDF0_9FIRM|nr:hypothetical protein [Anaeromicropila herbilytica]BCN31668.1 hypothetical protein bsdtb5_29630 [Anaeromicropila herbilytica]